MHRRAHDAGQVLLQRRARQPREGGARAATEVPWLASLTASPGVNGRSPARGAGSRAMCVAEVPLEQRLWGRGRTAVMVSRRRGAGLRALSQARAEPYTIARSPE